MSTSQTEKELRVYLSVDMEGITGIVDRDQVTRGGVDYQRACYLMTRETNAAVQGAIDAGATYVLVNDSHGSMRNILIEELHPEAHLITGHTKTYSMMEGIHDSFHVAAFIGYHARPGTIGGILDHTYSSASVYAIRVNGIEMPELGLNAWLAGDYNVPVVFLSGDRKACDQAREILGEGIATVAVMDGVGRSSAKALPIEKAQAEIRETLREAIERRAHVRPYRLRPPYEIEISFLKSSMAENPSLIPGVERLDGRTVRFVGNSVPEAFKLIRALIILAGAE